MLLVLVGESALGVKQWGLGIGMMSISDITVSYKILKYETFSSDILFYVTVLFHTFIMRLSLLNNKYFKIYCFWERENSEFISEITYLSLHLVTNKRNDSGMCPRSSSRRCNTNALVTVTVTVNDWLPDEAVHPSCWPAYYYNINFSYKLEDDMIFFVVTALGI